MARLRRVVSAPESRPMRRPSLALGMVVTLSAISRDGWSRPFAALGAIGRRNSGASVSSEVNPQMVIEAVSSKLSSWTMTTGRGLPA